MGLLKVRGMATQPILRACKSGKHKLQSNESTTAASLWIVILKPSGVLKMARCMHARQFTFLAVLIAQFSSWVADLCKDRVEPAHSPPAGVLP